MYRVRHGEVEINLFHTPVCPRSLSILLFYVFFLSPRCSPFMSCYNQILCALQISFKCGTRPSYLRTKFILCSDLCLCLPCAKILLTDIICFKWRTSHVIWWNCVNTIVCRESKYGGRNSKDYSDKSNRCCQWSKAQTLCLLNCSNACPVSYK